MVAFSWLFHKTTRGEKAKPKLPERLGVRERGRRPDANTDALFKAYSENELAYACVRIKSSALKAPKPIVQERQPDGTWKTLDDHPAKRLLQRPSPMLSGRQLMSISQTSWDVCGRVFHQKVRSKAGLVVQLNPLNPHLMTPYYNADQVQIGWTWKDGAKKINFLYEDLLYREVVPWAERPPVEVALGSIDADTAQTDFIRAFFDNGATPGGLLSTDSDLSDEDAEINRQRFNAKFGRRGKQHDTAVLGNNLRYTKIGSGLDELDSESVRSLTESRICTAFGVPPLIVYAYVGLLRATYSNLKEAWSSFWDSEIGPQLADWAEFFTWNLLTEFVPIEDLYAEKYRIAWDTSEVPALQDDVDMLYARAEKAFRAGGITLNEYRALLGKPHDPNGDVYIRLLSYAPAPFGDAPTTTADDLLSASKLAPVGSEEKAAPLDLEMQLYKRTQRYLLTEYQKAADAVAG